MKIINERIKLMAYNLNGVMNAEPLLTNYTFAETTVLSNFLKMV